MNYQKIYKAAIETYGENAQLDMAIEEMAELTKEICKHKRGVDNHNGIVEELCDVYITLEQLIIICEIQDDEILKMFKSKIERLSERLKNNA